MPRLARGPIPLLDLLLLLALAVAAAAGAARVYAERRSASFEMNAPPGLLPAAGLNELESFPGGVGNYRWTNGRGVLRLPNPGGAVVLQLSLAAGDGRLTPVELRAGGAAQRFVVAAGLRRYALLLPPSGGDRIPLQIDSPTFDDGGRSLGVLLSAPRLRGGGAPPWQALAALIAAICGAYALLCAAGCGRLLAAALVGFGAAGALLWLGAEGWRYGVWTLPLLLVAAASSIAVVFPLFMSSRERAKEAPPRLNWRREAPALALVLGLALAARAPLLAAPDPVGDLKLSARQMARLGSEGLGAAYDLGNDYMPLRLLILRGLSLVAPALGATADTPLPPATLVLLKLPGLLADAATIALIYAVARRWRSVAAAAGLALLYALAPPVWINVAWWGQVDALLMLPMLACALLLDRAGGRWSWLCWAAALLIKPQAIIIAPLLYAVTLRRYGARGVAQGAGLAAGLALAVCAPLALLQGGAGGIVQAYVGAVERFPWLTNQAYNLWMLVTGGRNAFDVGQGLGPLSYRAIGLLLTGAAALAVCAALLRRDDAAARFEGTAALALAFFLLPTQIHERYLFLSLAPLIVAAAAAPRLLPLFVVLSVTGALNIVGTLGGFSPALYDLIQGTPVPLVASAVNLAVLGALLVHLMLSREGQLWKHTAFTSAKTTSSSPPPTS
jgi:Gpi18-like mannosyltransferase